MSTTTRLVSGCVLASLLSTAGCSTSYTPRPSPRVAVVFEDGAPALEKNGTTNKIGPFGGGLVEAVEGVPEAEDHASTFRGRMIGGFVMSLAGAVAGGLGLGLLIANQAKDDPEDGLRNASLGLAFGGLGLSLTGSILMASAQPHFWDAINVYNDAVSPVPYPPPPGAWGRPPAPGVPAAAPAPYPAPAAPAPSPAPAPSAPAPAPSAPQPQPQPGVPFSGLDDARSLPPPLAFAPGHEARPRSSLVSNPPSSR